ncbi:hypothetical protein GHT06_022587 [Daphnia sinensis]|uniref:Reverse transcriptase domain-containing protein n=1 Tax=Daphnia sinensis TaxID=1820382 RepID=A0AAD5KIK8_9CRUS|nr:hypothetical protein GHT06_022587 [Daphnia sinensis]
MPFGLCNAPSTFQRTMEIVLKPIIGKCVMVYIDDIIVYSKDMAEHIQKFKFADSAVEYLGHIVSEDGVRVHPNKNKAVQKYQAPTNADQVRAFLVPWQWAQEEESAFQGIKECLCSAPSLAYPDFARPFILHTDACGYGVGGESPDDSRASNGNSTEDFSKSLEHPIAYTSKHLTDVQQKWCTTEKEAYAIAIAYALSIRLRHSSTTYAAQTSLL